MREFSSFLHILAHLRCRKPRSLVLCLLYTPRMTSFEFEIHTNHFFSLSAFTLLWTVSRDSKWSHAHFNFLDLFPYQHPNINFLGPTLTWTNANSSSSPPTLVCLARNLYLLCHNLRLRLRLSHNNLYLATLCKLCSGKCFLRSALPTLSASCSKIEN
jgi:hypothetical protein